MYISRALRAPCNLRSKSEHCLAASTLRPLCVPVHSRSLSGRVLQLVCFACVSALDAMLAARADSPLLWHDAHSLRFHPRFQVWLADAFETVLIEVCALAHQRYTSDHPCFGVYPDDPSATVATNFVRLLGGGGGVRLHAAPPSRTV